MFDLNQGKAMQTLTEQVEIFIFTQEVEELYEERLLSFISACICKGMCLLDKLRKGCAKTSMDYTAI